MSALRSFVRKDWVRAAGIILYICLVCAAAVAVGERMPQCEAADVRMLPEVTEIPESTLRAIRVINQSVALGYIVPLIAFLAIWLMMATNR